MSMTLKSQAWPAAACAGMPPELWEESSPDPDAAKQVCTSCTLQEACLEWAVEHQEWGIWGGKDDLERGIGGLCKQGHRMTEENVYVLAGRAACRACARERKELSRARQRFCKNGHERTRDNVYDSGSCKVCARAAARVSRERKKAKA